MKMLDFLSDFILSLNKYFLVLNLSYIFRTGSSFPHVVDVDWRLDYYIKVNRDKIFSPYK